MERITQANLKAVMDRMARALGAPTGLVWTRDADGNNRATVGALVLDKGSKVNGNAWAISQIVNEGGGKRRLVRASTARELWDLSQAWLDGARAMRPDSYTW